MVLFRKQDFENLRGKAIGTNWNIQYVGKNRTTS